MKLKYASAVAGVVLVSLWLGACSKQSLSGQRNQGKDKDKAEKAQTAGDVNLQTTELLDIENNLLNECLTKSYEDLLNPAAGFSKYTLTGKNLEKILTSLTKTKTWIEAQAVTKNDFKVLHADLNQRFELAKNILNLRSDLSGKEKFLFFEGLIEAVFPMDDALLNNDEVALIVKDLIKGDVLYFENTEEINALMRLVAETNKGTDKEKAKAKKDLIAQVEPISADQAEKLAKRLSFVKQTSELIAKKDASLVERQNEVSTDLVTTSGILEMKACSQMIIQKTEKKGDLTLGFAQAMRASIDLESVSKK